MYKCDYCNIKIKSIKDANGKEYKVFEHDSMSPHPPVLPIDDKISQSYLSIDPLKKNSNVLDKTKDVMSKSKLSAIKANIKRNK